MPTLRIISGKRERSSISASGQALTLGGSNAKLPAEGGGSARSLWHKSMRKKSNKNLDVNQMAYEMAIAIANGDIPKTADGKDPLAVALGRRGGLKGGPARAASLTASQRIASAKKAAQARWANIPISVKEK